MEIIAQMNAHMNETLNIDVALRMKLFGRRREEVQCIREKAANVQRMGVRCAALPSLFFMVIYPPGGV